MGGNFCDEEYENKPILGIKIHNRFEFKNSLKAPNIIPSLKSLESEANRAQCCGLDTRF